MKKACFHLPGLFEFYELYRMFLPLFYEHREYFYDDCEIGSIYGAPGDCLWGGGRIGGGTAREADVAALMREYGVSARLTFSNLLLKQEHLADRRCNALCRRFEHNGRAPSGIIVSSDGLVDHIRKNYPGFYLVSSTTKVITGDDALIAELDRPEFDYVVPDFRFNPRLDLWRSLSPERLKKVELLMNECCDFACRRRRACYENVSRKALGEDCADHVCTAPGAREGYVFTKAMRNPGFISARDVYETCLPMGVCHFKIEGRTLGSALVLEFLLYYLTKPEYHIHVREKIYLDASLDLF